MAATTLAIVGAATAVAGAGASFNQAAKQNRLMSEAETKAAEALAAGKRELEKNYYSGLAIQKEPYELQREAIMGTAAQAIEAGKESERGAAATAGKIFEGTQQGQADIRATMGKELSDLEKLKAAEESRLSGVKSGISLEEAAGYNQMAADAQIASAQAMTQGFGTIQQAAQQGLENLPLYFDMGKSKGDGKLANPNKIGTVDTGDIFSPFKIQNEAQRNAAINNAIFGSPMGANPQLRGITNQSAQYPMYMQYPGASRMSMNPFMIYQ